MAHSLIESDDCPRPPLQTPEEFQAALIKVREQSANPPPIEDTIAWIRKYLATPPPKSTIRP